MDTLKKGAARLHAFLFASLCAVYYYYYSYEEEEEEEHKRRTQKKKKRKEKKRDILYIIIIIIIIMPVPRGSLFGVPNENVKDKNEKHIQWDDDNLRENERTKSAKDIIDEPDTPWASPPPELFDSDAEEDEVLEEDLMNKRKTYAEEEIKERLERLELNTRQSTGVAFVLETTTTETSRSNFSSSDDNKEEEELKGENDYTILKSRLFEAQRKSLQCTYDRKRGTTFNKTSHPFVAQHREKEDDEEDKDEEEIKRELEALLNMQRKS